MQIQEHPIHCVDGKCMFPVKRSLQHIDQRSNYADLYGSENYADGKMKNMAIPLLVVQVQEENEMEGKPCVQNDGVISHKLYDTLLDALEIKPKQKKKPTTRKKRRK